MAWVERLSSGKYRGGWRDPAGRKQYTRRPEFPEHPYARKRDALEAAQEAEVQARRKAAAAQGVLSASATWGEWWDQTATFRTDTGTDATNRTIARLHLTPKWAPVPLNEITQVAVKAWVADLLGKGHSGSYVKRIYGVLRHSLNGAVEAGVLTASPCVGIKIKARSRTKSYVDNAYLESVAPHLAAHYRDMIKVGLETGLRPGELAGLHADVLDLDAGWLTVSKVWVDELAVIRASPKDEDEREVPLTPTAVAVLRARLAGRDLRAGCGVEHADGKECRSPLVFVNSRGNPISPRVWWSAMKRAADKAGVDQRGPYDVRHGFATLVAEGGMDPFELALILGHADVRQTQGYVHRTPGARDRLRAALGGSRLSVVRDAG